PEAPHEGAAREVAPGARPSPGAPRRWPPRPPSAADVAMPRRVPERRGARDAEAQVSVAVAALATRSPRGARPGAGPLPPPAPHRAADVSCWRDVRSPEPAHDPRGDVAAPRAARRARVASADR